jgi:MFS family permease
MVIQGSDGSGQRNRQNQARTTPYLYFVIFWTVLSTFNFGYGTSELNPLQHVLSCPSSATPSTQSLPSCIALSSSQFGYITAMFTVGGFLASLSLSPLKNRFSILRRSKNVLLMAAVWNTLGGLVQMMAGSWPTLALGRFVMGLGSGVAVAVVPSYLK